MTLDYEIEKVVNESRGFTTWLLGLSILFLILDTIITVSIIYGSLNSTPLIETVNWLLPSMIVILIIEIPFIIFSILLARTGSSSFSRSFAITGMGILTVSIWFDVLSTISATPDLAQEGNAFIRMAQELHFPLWSMYLLGFLAQLGFTLISCALWLSFLRHYKVYLQVIWAMDPRNLFQFIWAAIGGNLKSTTSHPKRELFSRSYRASWVILLCLIEPFPRYIFGLEWLGFPIGEWLFPYIGIGVSFLVEIIVLLVAVVFLSWLIYCYYSQKELYRQL